MMTLHHALIGALTLLLGLSSVTASPRADALLDTIDVFLTPTNMKQVGLDAAYAEHALLNVQHKRYRRVRALGALTTLAPARALELLPELAMSDSDREVRAQSVIHLARVFGASHPARVSATLASVRAAHTSDRGLCALIDAELKRAQARSGAQNGGL